MKVAIIVLNWNGRHYLEGCLDSLLRQTYKNYTIYFIDQGSTDGSVEFVRKNYRKKIKIIALPNNVGFAEGNNIGIRQALKNNDIKYVVVLNNDTAVEKDWLKEFIAGVERHPKAGSFACKIVIYNNPKMIDSAGMIFHDNCMPSGRGPGEPVENYDKEEEVFGAPGAAAMYKREMLEDIAPDSNYFDPEFFIYQEEFDLSWRSQLRGWKCFYIPQAIVRHIGSGTMRKLSKRSKYLLERNWIWALFKNAPIELLKYSFPRIIIYQLLSLCLYAFNGYLPAVIRGRIDGLNGLKKLKNKRNHITKSAKLSVHELIKMMKKRNYINDIKNNIVGIQ